jgi:hypothetical protein
MDIVEAIEKLEREWELEGGFFGDLQNGVFREEGLKNVISILSSISVSDDTFLDKRFVALTWFIPTFMSWQSERMGEQGLETNAIDHGAQTIIEILFRLLGAP